MRNALPIWTRLAQLGWVVLVISSLAKFSLSLVVYSQSADDLCTAGPRYCHEHQQLTPQDLESLNADGMTPEIWVLFNVLYRLASTLVFCFTGFLIFIQKRNDPAALLMSLCLILLGTIGGFGGYLSDKLPEFSFWFRLVEFPTYIFLAIFFFSFPTGRVVPRIMWLFILYWSSMFLSEFLFPGSIRQSLYYTTMNTIAWMGLFIGGFISQVYRYGWVSNAVERRQTLWLLLAFAMIAFFVIAGLLLPPLKPWFEIEANYSAGVLIFNAVSSLVFTLIPISVGIAILRYRLFDIDVIIRRTLIYTMLTAILGLVYLGVVTILQGVFASASQQSSNLGIVLSTLVIAAIFSPLRRRIQGFIDRRFYRKKYNAEQALAAFADLARSETDMSSLAYELNQMVSETLQPENVQLWLREKSRRLPFPHSLEVPRES
jgi:MFS family permease